jgi:hypothetical protein
MNDLDTEVAPFTTTFLPDVEALLESSGRPFDRVEGALRYELKAFDATYAWVYFVSAENFFIEGVPEKKAYEAFRRRQAELLEEELYARPRKEMYLFVVGAAEILLNPAHMALRWTIEHDSRVAKKAVMLTSEVEHWLDSPFKHLQGDARANEKPTFTGMRELDLRAEQPSVANHVFNPHAILSTCEEDFAGDALSAQKSLVNTLYQRVMGSTHKVYWDEDGPSLGRMGDKSRIPLYCCSMGERLIFAFAIFLARASEEVFPEMCIGIHGDLNGMDPLRRISAIDCLREFVISTGVSVVIQSAKSEVTAIAQSRLGSVMEAAAQETSRRNN